MNPFDDKVVKHFQKQVLPHVGHAQCQQEFAQGQTIIGEYRNKANHSYWIFNINHVLLMSFFQCNGVSHFYCRRIDDFFLEDENSLGALKRQGETSIEEVPIFDQHVSYLTSLPASIWVFPLGIFAVGLKYKDAIIEFTELIYGLVSNILQSILGMNE